LKFVERCLHIVDACGRQVRATMPAPDLHRRKDTLMNTSTTPALPALHDAGALAGRLLLALLFVPAGIAKATGFDGTVGYIASAGLPLATAAALFAIVLEIAGGLALVAGWRTRSVALAFAGFTLVASFAFHAYWAVPAEQQFVQQLLFFKNLAVVGGLLLLAAHGAGRWSLDARQGARPAQPLSRRYA
jgi:putative oxidoreductase